MLSTRRGKEAPVQGEKVQEQERWPPVFLKELLAERARVRKTSGQLAPILAYHLALVWCLKPQLSMAAGAAGAAGVAGAAGTAGAAEAAGAVVAVAAVAAPMCNFQDGIAVAEEAEAATAALESGCCSAAAVVGSG